MIPVCSFLQESNSETGSPSVVPRAWGSNGDRGLILVLNHAGVWLQNTEYVYTCLCTANCEDGKSYTWWILPNFKNHLGHVSTTGPNRRNLSDPRECSCPSPSKARCLWSTCNLGGWRAGLRPRTHPSLKESHMTTLSSMEKHEDWHPGYPPVDSGSCSSSNSELVFLSQALPHDT